MSGSPLRDNKIMKELAGGATTVIYFVSLPVLLLEKDPVRYLKGIEDLELHTKYTSIIVCVTKVDEVTSLLSRGDIAHANSYWNDSVTLCAIYEKTR